MRTYICINKHAPGALCQRRNYSPTKRSRSLTKQNNNNEINNNNDYPGGIIYIINKGYRLYMSVQLRNTRTYSTIYKYIKLILQGHFPVTKGSKDLSI